MPAVIPLAAAFASGAFGAVIAGTATAAAYATVAGAVLSTVGAVTKNKHLSMIGAVVGLGGGLASLSSGMSKAASAAAGGAAAGEAAGAAAGAAGTAADGANWANTAFTSSLGTNAPAGVLDTASLASRAAGTAPPAGLNMATAFSDAAAAGAPTAARSLMDVANPLAAQTASSAVPSLVPPAQTAGLLGTDAATSFAWDAPASALGEDLVSTAGGMRPATDALSRAASEMTGDSLRGFLQSPSGQSAFSEWMKKAGNGAKSLADFVKENKEVVQLGGRALAAINDPNAAMVRLREQQMERERSLFDLAHRNMNNVVPLVYLPGGGR